MCHRNFSLNQFVLIICIINLGFSLTAKAQTTTESFYGNPSYDNRIIYATQTNDGDYILSGYAGVIGEDTKMWLLRISNSGSLTWSKHYSDFGVNYAYSIKPTSDGNFLVCGLSNVVTGDDNSFFLKVDNSGNLIWNKFIGGQDNDQFWKMEMINSNTALAIGCTGSYGFGNADIYMVAMRDDGTVLWKKVIGKIWNDWGNDIIKSSDGNILITGFTDTSPNVNYNLYLIKCDSLGNPIWGKYYDAPNYDRAYNVVETSDGGFLLCGETSSFFGSRNVILLKVDANGYSQWGKLLGGAGNENAYGMINTSDGNIIVSGITESFGIGNTDGFLLKLTEAGNIIWFKTYGSAYEDVLYSVIETPDSGFLAVGWSNGYNGQKEMGYVVKTDKEGNTGCQNNQSAEFVSLNLPTANLSLGYLSAGSEFSVLLDQTTPNSISFIKCEIVPVELKSFNYKLENRDVILNWSTATEINNQGFKVFRGENEIGYIPGSGTTTEPREYSFKDENVKTGTYVYELIQIDYDGTSTKVAELEVSVDNIPSGYILEQNYPNPFNPTTTLSFVIGQSSFVSLKVFDVLGNEVVILVDEYKYVGEYEVEFDATGLPSGIYFYQLKADSYIQTKKMIYLK